MSFYHLKTAVAVKSVDLWAASFKQLLCRA